MTHQAKTPIGTVLRALADAELGNRVGYTLVPEDCRPPRVEILFDSAAAARDFTAALGQVARILGPAAAPPTMMPPTLDDVVGEMLADGARLAACADGLDDLVVHGPVMTCDTCRRYETCERPPSGIGCWEARHG